MELLERWLVDIEPFSWKSILTCVICGSVIGFERQYYGKPAGIRTSIIICMSTYIFVAISKSVVNFNGDYTRVIGQIVTGVGFLGAGVMFSKKGLVIGVTSASFIWLIAGLGSIIGIGLHRAAIIFAVISIVITFLVGQLERLFKGLKKGVHDDNYEE